MAKVLACRALAPRLTVSSHADEAVAEPQSQKNLETNSALCVFTYRFGSVDNRKMGLERGSHNNVRVELHIPIDCQLIYMRVKVSWHRCPKTHNRSTYRRFAVSRNTNIAREGEQAIANCVSAA